MTKKQTETKPAAKAPAPEAQAASERSFFEIVNWKKAQSMKEPDAAWLKLYTSILDNDRIDGLDDKSYRLLNGIWALAARLGKYILPADPKWLMGRIPFLKSEPDLRPLLDAKNMYGHPEPFLRLCGPPGPNGSAKDGSSQQEAAQGDGGGSDVKAGKKQTARKPAAEKEPLYEKAVVLVSSCGYASARAISNELGIKYGRAQRIVKSMLAANLVGEYVHRKGRKLNCALRAAREEERREEKRVEQNREDPAPLRASDHPEEERKSLTGFPKEAERQSTAEKSSSEQPTGTADQSSSEPEKPANPTNSDAGAAKGHHVPRPPRSASPRRPEAIGAILGRRFEPWWGDMDCEAFGWEIAGALGYSTDRLNVESRSQWGVFAAWWYRVRAVAPAAVLDELRGKAVAKANHLRTKKAKYVRKPGAVWLGIMAGELAKHGVGLPDPRAGPEAASI